MTAPEVWPCAKSKIRLLNKYLISPHVHCTFYLYIHYMPKLWNYLYVERHILFWNENVLFVHTA